MRNKALKVVFLGHQKYTTMYKESLENAGYKFFTVTNFEEIEAAIKEIKPDLGVIACFGKIIPENILKIPVYGFINIHPSLLPRWRGPSPARSALFMGEKETGVTIHITTPKIDAGDIILQKKFLIHPNDDYITLEERLFSEGAKMLPLAIKRLINNDIEPQKQNESEATYSKKVRTEDGLINLERTPQEIINQIRAYSPNPGVYIIINGQRLKIKKAEILTGPTQKWPVIQCKDGALKLLVVQPEGKKDMSGDAYLRGRPIIRDRRDIRD